MSFDSGIQTSEQFHDFIVRSGGAQAWDWCIRTFMSPGESDAHTLGELNTSVPHWERACVIQMEKGQSEAFDPLVHYYSGRIYAHIYRMVRNREEAEDLTQETFVLAYRRIETYDKSRPFRNWLYAIATNVAKNAIRSRERRIPSAKIEQDTEVSVEDTKRARVLDSHELKEQLAQAVDTLPEPLPTLIHLHYQEGLTIGEAATILDMTEGAAKVAMHRARKNLRKLLERDGR